MGCCTDPLTSVRIGTPDEIQDFAKPEVALTRLTSVRIGATMGG